MISLRRAMTAPIWRERSADLREDANAILVASIVGADFKFSAVVELE
jgi:hypothetical protein